MVGWHHRLYEHEFEQAPGDGEGQGRLVYCSPWGRKELDMTERLNNNYIYIYIYLRVNIYMCVCVYIYTRTHIYIF